MRERKSEKGFTLVEVLTALLILSVGMLGVGAMLMTSMRSDVYNAQVRAAEHLANQKIEELRGKSADASLPTSSGNWPPTGITSRYVYSWTVTADPDTTRRISQVEVLVGWPVGTDFPNCRKDQVTSCDNRVRVIAFIPQQ
jgi:prepilin-type N-terminal cleavage/methylation domain-containing protein